MVLEQCFSSAEETEKLEIYLSGHSENESDREALIKVIKKVLPRCYLRTTEIFIGVVLVKKGETQDQINARVVKIVSNQPGQPQTEGWEFIPVMIPVWSLAYRYEDPHSKLVAIFTTAELQFSS
jgi:hypothetical protein